MVLVEALDCSQIREHKPLKSPFLSKDLLEQEGIRGNRNAVDFVIGSHGRHGMSLAESRLKRLEHDGAQLALSHMDRRGVGATLRGAMSGKMLGLSYHGVVCIQAFALRPAHVGEPQLPGQVRIFPEIFFDASPARLPSEIEDGSKNHANTRRPGLSCDGGSGLL